MAHNYAFATASGNAIQSPTQGAQPTSAQPKSVKHLTCWYWAKGRCRLPDDQCLYSHFNTGNVACAPVQLQPGRKFSLGVPSAYSRALTRANAKLERAVAGRNATILQPIYRESKRHHRARLPVADTQIDRQIQRIHAKAKQLPTRTPVKTQQPPSSGMVKQEQSSFAGPFNYNQLHPDDSMSPAPGGSYRNLSIGIGTSNQPMQRPFDSSPHQFGGSFVPFSPAAHYPSSPTHFGAGGEYGMGGDYGSTGGVYGDMGGDFGDPSGHYSGTGGGYGHMNDRGPDPHHLGSGHNPNLSSSSTQPGDPSDHLIRELQQQSQVKDQAITELAGIIAMLEINYGFAIKDQTDTLETLLRIARSMKEEEARAAEGTSPYLPHLSLPISKKELTNPPPFHRPRIHYASISHQQQQHLDTQLRPHTSPPRPHHDGNARLPEPHQTAKEHLGRVQESQAGGWWGIGGYRGEETAAVGMDRAVGWRWVIFYSKVVPLRLMMGRREH